MEQVGDDIPPSTIHQEDVLHILQSLWRWNYTANLLQNSVTCNAACHLTQPATASAWCRDIHG
eukprot:4636490-Ditylum_brightwellii.AAC.2